MHCSGCGLIIGKDFPPELCSCPQCAHVLRVLRYGVEDGFDAHQVVPAETSRKRFVGVYTSEAMVRFLVSTRTPRAVLWEPLLIELEEERLKAFVRSTGWVLASVFRDPGPRAPEAKRPFARLEKDLAEGVVNALLVTDFSRVPRKDVHALHELCRREGAEILSISPHPHDVNLAHESVDHDDADAAWGRVPELERLWTPAVSKALDTLLRAAGWHWTSYSADILARAMGAEAVKAWRLADPACRERPWREVLTRFAMARVRGRGDYAKLPLPVLLTCALCRRRYLDSALPAPLMELTAGRGGYCTTCLSRAFFHDARGAASGSRAPLEIDSRADAEAGSEFFRELPRERLHSFLKTLLDRIEEAEKRSVSETPSNAWLGALRDLGILRGLGEVARVDSFYRAADGHLSTSLGAALVCNWLQAQGVPHRLDARYPPDDEKNPYAVARADFLARDVFVEFLGLRGRDEFKKKITDRVEVASRAGQTVVGIHAEDLLVPSVLERKTALLCRASAETGGERRAS